MRESRDVRADGRVADGGEAWRTTPLGMRILERQRQLIEHMVSAWPRRNASLIEIGCGAGNFLEIFWSSGFDVTGTDADQNCLRQAGTLMGQKAVLRLAQPGHLPFDDDEFDFAVLIGRPGYDPALGLHEAFRLVRRGVLIVFFNRWSLFRVENALRSFSVSGVVRMCGKLPSGVRDAVEAGRKAALEGAAGMDPAGSLGYEAGDRPVPERKTGYCWSSPAEMAAAMRAYVNKKPDAFRSVLFCPSRMWGEDKGGLSRASLLPFGAIAALRLDISPFAGATGKQVAVRPVPAVR